MTKLCDSLNPILSGHAFRTLSRVGEMKEAVKVSIPSYLVMPFEHS